MLPILLAVGFGVLINAPPCEPTRPAPRAPYKKGPSLSFGRPSAGSLENAKRLPSDSTYLKVLLARHRARRLDFAADELAEALERAAIAVEKEFPGAVLWVGNIAAPYGGSLAPYSVSHQRGLDADLAFYLYEPSGKLAAPEDLVYLNRKGESADGFYRLAVPLQWALVAALLQDPAIKIEYLFLYDPLVAMLMRYAEEKKVDPALLEKAKQVLFQPRDAGPHQDHLHVRIACPTRQEEGCVSR